MSHAPSPATPPRLGAVTLAGLTFVANTGILIVVAAVGYASGSIKSPPAGLLLAIPLFAAWMAAPALAIPPLWFLWKRLPGIEYTQDEDYWCVAGAWLALLYPNMEVLSGAMSGARGADTGLVFAPLLFVLLLPIIGGLGALAGYLVARYTNGRPWSLRWLALLFAVMGVGVVAGAAMGTLLSAFGPSGLALGIGLVVLAVTGWRLRKYAAAVDAAAERSEGTSP